MQYINPNCKINLEWQIMKGVGNVEEDFSRSTVKLFLSSTENRQVVSCTADENGLVKAVLPTELTEGVYSVDLLWIKNENNVLETRSINRTTRKCLFGIDSNVAMKSEATIKCKTTVASYGYDGLSAYELGVLRGNTEASESEWVGDIKGLNENFVSLKTRMTSVETKVAVDETLLDVHGGRITDLEQNYTDTEGMNAAISGAVATTKSALEAKIGTVDDDTDLSSEVSGVKMRLELEQKRSSSVMVDSLSAISSTFASIEAGNLRAGQLVLVKQNNQPDCYVYEVVLGNASSQAANAAVSTQADAEEDIADNYIDASDVNYGYPFAQASGGANTPVVTTDIEGALLSTAGYTVACRGGQVVLRALETSKRGLATEDYVDDKFTEKLNDVDFSTFAKKSEVNTKLAGYQEKITTESELAVGAIYKGARVEGDGSNEYATKSDVGAAVADVESGLSDDQKEALSTLVTGGFTTMKTNIEALQAKTSKISHVSGENYTLNAESSEASFGYKSGNTMTEQPDQPLQVSAEQSQVSDMDSEFNGNLTLSSIYSVDAPSATKPKLHNVISVQKGQTIKLTASTNASMLLFRQASSTLAQNNVLFLMKTSQASTKELVYVATVAGYYTFAFATLQSETNKINVKVYKAQTSTTTIDDAQVLLNGVVKVNGEELMTKEDVDELNTRMAGMQLNVADAETKVSEMQEKVSEMDQLKQTEAYQNQALSALQTWKEEVNESMNELEEAVEQAKNATGTVDDLAESTRKSIQKVSNQITENAASAQEIEVDGGYIDAENYSRFKVTELSSYAMTTLLTANNGAYYGHALFLPFPSKELLGRRVTINIVQRPADVFNGFTEEQKPQGTNVYTIFTCMNFKKFFACYNSSTGGWTPCNCIMLGSNRRTVELMCTGATGKYRWADISDSYWAKAGTDNIGFVTIPSGCSIRQEEQEEVEDWSPTDMAVTMSTTNEMRMDVLTDNYQIQDGYDVRTVRAYGGVLPLLFGARRTKSVSGMQVQEMCAKVIKWRVSNGGQIATLTQYEENGKVDYNGWYKLLCAELPIKNLDSWSQSTEMTTRTAELESYAEFIDGTTVEKKHIIKLRRFRDAKANYEIEPIAISLVAVYTDGTIATFSSTKTGENWGDIAYNPTKTVKGLYIASELDANGFRIIINKGTGEEEEYYPFLTLVKGARYSEDNRYGLTVSADNTNVVIDGVWSGCGSGSNTNMAVYGHKIYNLPSGTTAFTLTWKLGNLVKTATVKVIKQ